METRFQPPKTDTRICVASVTSDDEATLTREIFHYAQQYMQDGQITIKNASPSIVEMFRDLMVHGGDQPKDTPDGK